MSTATGSSTFDASSVHSAVETPRRHEGRPSLTGDTSIGFGLGTGVLGLFVGGESVSALPPLRNRPAVGND